MRRFFTTCILGVVLTASPAFAADADVKMPTLTISEAAMSAATEAPAASPDFSTAISARLRRPSALPALYAASAALQGYDAYSTLSVLKAGGIEANPMMKTVTKSPAVFVALKVGMAATSIMAAERLWKNGNRMAAVGVMVAANVGMAMVATNNAKVLSRLK